MKKGIGEMSSDLLLQRCGFNIILDYQNYKIILRCTGRIASVNKRKKTARVQLTSIKDSQAIFCGTERFFECSLEEIELASDAIPENKGLWNELLEAFVNEQNILKARRQRNT